MSVGVNVSVRMSVSVRARVSASVMVVRVRFAVRVRARVRGYGRIGVGVLYRYPDIERQPPTIRPLTRAKRMCTLTDPLSKKQKYAPHYFPRLGACLCRAGLGLSVWRRVYTYTLVREN